jgi:hypothetical protein
MIGNQGGFSLFQMMEDMNRKLDEQRRDKSVIVPLSYST